VTPGWTDKALRALKAGLGEPSLDRLRRLPAYSAWRRLREHAQVERFGNLLASLPPDRPLYNEEALKAALTERAAQKRALERAQPVGIACYGVRDWEDNGLWQAAARVGASTLFDLRASPPAKRASAGERRASWGRAFLAEVDKRGRTSAPVHVAFFYAGAADLDVALIDQLHQRGIWTVLLGLDDKSQLSEPPNSDVQGRQPLVAKAVDLYWTTWRTGADLLWAQGARPWYAAPGADPGFFQPVSVPARDIDVLWLGRLYGPRLALVRFLSAHGIRVESYGPGTPHGPVPFEEMLRLYSRAKVVLGMGGVGQTDQFKHLKGRDFEVPMAGAAYLTSFNPELVDHFGVGREILCYASLPECLDVLSWILPREARLTELREAARARCLREHTWESRFRHILGLLGLGVEVRPNRAIFGSP
jgi:hypothetical protein